MDKEKFADTGFAPPNKFAACVVGGNSPAPRPGVGTPACSDATVALQPTPSSHRVRLTWNGPNGGTVSSYTVLRTTGSTFSLLNYKTLSGTVRSFTDPNPPFKTTYYFDDVEELPDAVPFTYAVFATFTDGEGGNGPISNTDKVVARNDAPAVVADSYPPIPQDGVLVVPAAGVLANDTDTDSVNPVLRVTADSPVTAPAHGSLTLNANGSFTYTPIQGFFGTDTFTYKAKDDRKWPLPLATGVFPMSPDSTTVTVTITVNKKKK
jgi:hypothetical protein